MAYHVAGSVANLVASDIFANVHGAQDNGEEQARLLFRRRGSKNFWIKLRSPAGRIELSLGTPSRRQAEISAGPMITAHKTALFAARPHLQTVRKLEPGVHPGPDGGKIVANETRVDLIPGTLPSWVMSG
jgi:hypothetical protein